MNIGFDWSETSTKRGLVRFATFIIGLIMIWTGHGDVEKLLVLAAGVNGGLGMLVKDK